MLMLLIFLNVDVIDVTNALMLLILLILMCEYRLEFLLMIK